MVNLVLDNEEGDEPPPIVNEKSSLDENRFSSGSKTNSVKEKVLGEGSLEKEELEALDDYVANLEALYIKEEEKETSLREFFERESVITSYEQDLIKSLIDDVEAYQSSVYELGIGQYNPAEEENKNTFTDYDDCFVEYWVDKTPTLELDYIQMVTEDDSDNNKIMKKFFSAAQQNSLRAGLNAYLNSRQYYIAG